MAVNYTLSSDRELYHYLSMPEHRERAFEEIYRRYGQRIYAYCRKILFNTQDAEDAFQSTFLKFLSSVSPDREMTNLPAYLLTIARTTCMDMFAQRHEHAELVEDFHGSPIKRSKPMKSMNSSRWHSTCSLHSGAKRSSCSSTPT